MITTMIVARISKRFSLSTIIPRLRAFGTIIHSHPRYYFVTLP